MGIEITDLALLERRVASLDLYFSLCKRSNMVEGVSRDGDIDAIG